jgi:hypothetical protein
MSGGQQYAGRGDPEWVNVVPVEQFLSRYAFYTDPTFPETRLVVVRARRGRSFYDVSLDCLGTISNWMQATINDDVEYAYVVLSRNAFESPSGCTNGTHTMSSEGPFGVTVWAWGNKEVPDYDTSYTSYAYPAGAGLRTLNNVALFPDAGSP